MLTPSDISNHADFALGRLTVSPSTRRVSSGDSSLTLEPRVMQVLVLLSRHPNQVVTRELLFDEVWGGAMVGDDSINRSIAGVRRAVELDSENLAIETIPRTGYMLKVEGEEREIGRSRFDRRTMVMGSALGLGLAGAGLWLKQSRDDNQFNELIDRGEKALSYGDPANNPADLLERAVALRPGDSGAQGLLAYARAMEASYQSTAAAALPVADRAARAALALDANEPNARLAQTLIRQTSLDFAQTEGRLIAILKTAPNNVQAMRHYWNLLQCVGRSREALTMVERALKVEPLGAAIHYPLAQLLWINGSNAEADRVIDRALHYWPEHRFVRFARFTILAFTDRPRAALAMLDHRDTVPQNFSPQGIALWRVSLAALDQRTPSTIAAALDANMEAAKSDLRLTSQAANVLSELGKVDAAFELTNALFVVEGAPFANSPNPATSRSKAWRFAPWLFVPPMAAVRSDPRFSTVCDEIGLTDYWERRRVRPDYRLG